MAMDEEALKKLAEKRKRVLNEIESQQLSVWQSYAPMIDVCGFKLKPLTLSALVDLQAAKNGVIENPFSAKVGDLMAYIWRNWEKWDAASEGTRAGKRRFRKFCKRIAKLTHVDVVHGCARHFIEAVSESPNCGSDRSRTVRSNKVSPIPSVASIVDALCHEYSARPDEVLSWPLKRCFQLLRCIRMRYSPDANFPEHPDIVALKSEYLNLRNAEN